MTRPAAPVRGEMQEQTPRGHLTVLVFEIDDHRYAVDARRVQEIVRAVLPARLPSAPAVIAGVINVRGAPVPVIDLRARFGLPARPLAVDEVFVLVHDDGRLLGFRADRALSLVRVPAETLASLERVVPRADYTAGTLLLPDGVLLICDVARFLDDAERATLVGALAEHARSSHP